MMTLLHEAFSLVNLPYTVLLILMFLYWALYLLGTFGSETLDFLNLDFDLDADVDVDADLDADAEVTTGGHGGLLSGAFHFLHVGQVPVTIIFSVLILAMWTASILANHFLQNTSVLVALALLVPIVMVGLMVTKSIIMPLAPALQQLFDQSGDKVEIMGKTCVVTSSHATPEFGQAEFADGGTSILLNVKTRDGVTLTKGEEAVVFDHDQEKDVYLIAPLDINTQPQSEESP